MNKHFSCSALIEEFCFYGTVLTRILVIKRNDRLHYLSIIKMDQFIHKRNFDREEKMCYCSHQPSDRCIDTDRKLEKDYSHVPFLA